MRLRSLFVSCRLVGLLAGLLTGLLASLAPSTALAAGELEQLLQRVQQHAADSKALDSDREAKFLAAREQRAALLEQARAKLLAMQQREQALRKILERNDASIAAINATLAEHSADLRQLFQRARHQASSLKSLLQYSLVSARWPHRSDQLAPLLDEQHTPTIAELRSLWLLMMQEAIEAGRSERFMTDLIAADGSRQRAKVTRIGVFSALHDGQPLRFENGQLYQLQHQPEAGLVRTAAAFEHTDKTMAAALIDPSRGAWLEVLTQSPSLLERVRQGGVIGMIIIALAAIGLSIGLWRLLAVTITGWQMQRQLTHPEQPSQRNPLGRVLLAWHSLQQHTDPDPLRMELQLHQAALREVPRLTRAQSFLKLLAAVTPLLGLLGTVTGMILTFQAIGLAGAANTGLMANGIGQALITTVLGLIAAIPLLFVHNLLASRSRALIQVLDRESAGLIVTSLTPTPATTAMPAAETA